MKPRIHYAKPSITELEIRYATDAAANGWGENCYDYIVRFEESFKTHLGVKYAIATSSCTGALHMAAPAPALDPDHRLNHRPTHPPEIQQRQFF
ncbi:MAG: DegT/DnrJ/EryC1/StrS family aminotransferase [Porticoccaceae bacterium]